MLEKGSRNAGVSVWERAKEVPTKGNIGEGVGGMHSQ